MDDGKPLKKQVDHDGEGFFIKVVKKDVPSGDTLTVYIQGVVKGKVKPNRKKASKADLVIWCFPSTYRHPNHIFPDAEGRVYLLERDGRIAAATEEFFEEYVHSPNVVSL